MTARADVSGFESFLASYFDEAFPSPYVLARQEGGGEIRGDSFLLGQKSYGDWLMFTPQAGGGEHLIRDGRWKLEPNPVSWTIVRRLAAPLCFRRGRADGLTAIVMAPKEDCFAVATPHAGEAHYSLYLSLFGRDLKAGQTAKARTRFVVAPDLSDELLITMYRQYLDELKNRL